MIKATPTEEKGEMDRSEKMTETIIRNAYRVTLSEIGPVDISELEFEDWVRDFCKNGCRSYNSSWACPPAVGTLEECRERCLQYRNMMLFDKCYKLSGSFDSIGVQNAMSDFKLIVDRYAELLSPILSRSLFLTNEGCTRCEKCTWPDAPCRFPEKLHHTIEGYGFNITKMARRAGLHYNGGPNTVTFFGAVLYDI